jgi:hypothetical protein
MRILKSGPLAIMMAGLLAACGDGGSPSTDGSPRLSLTEREVGSARAGVSFRVSGSADIEASAVRLTVAGFAEDGFTVTDDGPAFYSIQLIEGARGEPRATVMFYLPPDIASGDHQIVDSLEFLGDEPGNVGGVFVQREQGANRFFTVIPPGEIRLTRSGDRLSGDFRYSARKIQDEDYLVEITGEFRDVDLRSTIRN